MALQGTPKTANTRWAKVMNQAMDSNNVADEDEKESFVMRPIAMVDNECNNQLFNRAIEKGCYAKKIKIMSTTFWEAVPEVSNLKIS